MLARPNGEKPGVYKGMTANTLPGPGLSLGAFLRDCRARIAPAEDAPVRRRTPGLRREEVAARAGVSITWYTWLEQGRGGPPSDAVLEQLARALELDSAGREVLFLLGRQRLPPPKPAASAVVTPALQRVLDAMAGSPALVKTPAWDILAWNRAAARVLADYAALPVRERNILRRLFEAPTAAATRAALPDWEENARFAIAVLRIDAARAGGSPEAEALADELQAVSEDFRRLWAENGMRTHGAGIKRLHHRLAGPLTLEYSAFPVDGAEGLTMIVFNPATPGDAEAIARLLASEA